MSANIEGVARPINYRGRIIILKNKMADDELQAIRAKRLAELQAQYGGEKVDLLYLKQLI